MHNKAGVQNKTEDLNLSVFDIIKGIYKLQILTNHKSCECKCTFVTIKCNSNQKWNSAKYWCECKNPKEHRHMKNIIFRILVHVVMEMLNI